MAPEAAFSACPPISFALSSAVPSSGFRFVPADAMNVVTSMGWISNYIDCGVQETIKKFCSSPIDKPLPFSKRLGIVHRYRETRTDLWPRLNYPKWTNWKR